jgi:hypothetical protein
MTLIKQPMKGNFKRYVDKISENLQDQSYQSVIHAVRWIKG